MLLSGTRLSRYLTPRQELFFWVAFLSVFALTIFGTGNTLLVRGIKEGRLWPAMIGGTLHAIGVCSLLWYREYLHAEDFDKFESSQKVIDAINSRHTAREIIPPILLLNFVGLFALLCF